MVRWLKLIGRTLFWVLVGAGGLVGLVLGGLATDAGNELIRKEVLAAAAPSFPNGTLVVGEVDTNLLGHLYLSDVAIQDADGKDLVHVERFVLDYSLGALLNKELRVEALRLERPSINLTVNADGEMDILTVFGPSEETDEPDAPVEPFAGLPIDITLAQFAIVDGKVNIEDPAGSTAVPDLDFKVGIDVRGSTVSVNNIELDVDLDSPLDQPVSLGGSLALASGDLNISDLMLGFGEIQLQVAGAIQAAETKPVLDLKLRVDPLSPATLEALAGQAVIKAPLVVEADIAGPMSALTVDGNIPSPSGDGQMAFHVNADLESEPLAWGVKLNPSNFVVDSVTELVPAPFVMDGVYSVKGTGTEYPSGMDADIRVDCGPQIFAGERVDSLKLHGRLDAGRLGLDIKEVIHEVARVSLVANVNLLDSNARARASINVPNAAKLRKYGVEDMAGSVRYDGDIVAAWEPEVDVDLEGDLKLTSFAAPGVFIEAGGGPIHAQLKGEHAEATGDIQLQGLDASGTTIDSIQLIFEGSQSADGTVGVDADLHIGVIAMPDGQFDMQGLDGKMVARIPAKGDMAASADLTVKTFRFGDGDYSVDGGPVHFAMNGDEIEANIDLRRRDTPFLAGSIVGDLGTGLWNIDGFQFAVIQDDGLDAQQSMQFRLADGGAKDIVVEIANNDGKGSLKIEGQATADEPDLRLTADKIDLSYVVQMLDEVIDLSPPPTDEAKTDSQVDASKPDPLEDLSGLASMDFTLKGQDGLLNAGGWIEVEDLVMPGQINKIDTRVDVELTDTDASVTVRVGDDEKTLFWSKSAVPIVQKAGEVTVDCDKPVHLRSMVPGVDFKKLGKQIPAIGNELRGRASLDLKVDGDACNPNVGVVAAMDTAVGAQGERVRLDVQFDRKGDSLELKTTVEQENQRIAQVGAVLATRLTEALQALLINGEDVDLANPDNWLDEFDVKLALQRTDLGRLVRMGEITHPVEGTMGGGFRLSGTMEHPEIQGGLVLAGGRVGEAKMRQFTVGLVPEGDGYALATILDFFGSGGLNILGYIPLELRFDGEPDLSREGLEIKIEGDGIPLAMAAGPTGLADATGTIRLSGEVKGTLANPIPKVTVGSDEAGFTLLATALRYDPIDLDIDYQPDKLVINDISIRSSQLWGQNPKSGTFSVKGQVGLGEDGPTDVSITTKMKEFWLAATRQASVATSGKVSVKGAYPALKIRGAIEMDEASISVGEEVLKDTSGFEIDDTIQIHRTQREVVAKRREDEAEESVADNFSVDLKVDLAQKVRLKADVPLSEDFGSQFSQLATFNLDIGLDGVLDIGQEEGVLSVVGELATMRGEMVALGKRFTLTEGDITFTGENYVNPQLNILAAHQVGQYGSVDIAISGDVENTAMELSSPEYPDQTDVMSMLLFGKPTSAMSETEGESGSGLLSAAMASVGGQAARATGAAFLQNVQIDPGSGSVKVGFPLTDKIYLSIERVTPEEDTDNVTQAALEWILSRQTYGELITGDRGQSSGDLYWRWRF